MIHINRHPFLYVAVLLAVLVVHAWLCFPASTYRGHPPLAALWQFVAIYLGFLGVFLAPAFEDFDDFPALRWAVLGVFVALACLVLGVALANINGLRPHTARIDWAMVNIYAVQSAVLAGPFVFCFESGARAFWNRIRRFSPAPGV